MWYVCSICGFFWKADYFDDEKPCTHCKCVGSVIVAESGPEAQHLSRQFNPQYDGWVNQA